MSASLAVGIGLCLTLLIATAVGLLIHFVKPAGRGFGTFDSTHEAEADDDEADDEADDEVDDEADDVRRTPGFACQPGATPMTVDGINMCTTKRIIASAMHGTVMLSTERATLSDAIDKCVATAGCTGLVQFAFRAVTTAAVDDTGATFDHRFSYTHCDSPYFCLTGPAVPTVSTATIVHRAFV